MKCSHNQILDKGEEGYELVAEDKECGSLEVYGSILEVEGGRQVVEIIKTPSDR